MPVPDHLRCHFRAADGKRCRMFRDPQHPSLCVAHARRTFPAQCRRKRDVVVLPPPSPAESNAMLNQCMIWLVGRLITVEQGNRFVRSIRRAQRGMPFASLDWTDTWKELCDTVNAQLTGQAPPRSTRRGKNQAQASAANIRNLEVSNASQ